MYIVNYMIIDRSHIIHAKEKLGLMGADRITKETINHAYSDLFSNISERRRSEPVIIDIAELRATKLYMLDRWVYLTHEN